MWLCTTQGFFSIVRGHNAEDDSPRWMIRARHENHLDRLIDLVWRDGRRPRMGSRQRPEIVTTSDTDYRYRIIVDAEDYMATVTAIGEDVSYPNFKNAAHEVHGVGGYVDALHDIWHRMYSLQLEEIDCEWICFECDHRQETEAPCEKCGASTEEIDCEDDGEV